MPPSSISLRFRHFCCSSLLVVLVMLGSFKLSAQAPGSKAEVDSISAQIRSVLYGNTQKADSLINLALGSLGSLNYPEGELKIRMYRGVLRDVQARYDESLREWARVERLATKLQDTVALGLVFINRGIILYNTDHYENSMEAYDQAERIFTAIGDSARLAAISTNKAHMYERLRDYEEAERYFKRSIDLTANRGDKRSAGLAIGSLGALYVSTGDYREALRYLDLGDTYFDPAHETWQFAKSHYNRAMAYVGMNEIDSARYHAARSFAMFSDMEDMLGISGSYSLIAEIDLMDKKFESALENLNRSRYVADSAGLTTDARVHYELAARIYNELGQFDSAYVYSQKMLALADSTQGQWLDKIRQSIDLKNDSQQKDSELQELTAENREISFTNRTLRWLLIGGAILLLLVVVATAVLVVLGQRQKRLNRILAEKNALIDRQLEALAQADKAKSQLFTILAHDLRSPLSALHSTIHLMQSSNLTDQERDQVLAGLSEALNDNGKMLDNILYWAHSQMKGIETRKDQFSLMPLASDVAGFYKLMADAKSIRIHVTGDPQAMAWADREHIQLVLRNLLHNALKFTNKGAEVNLVVRSADDLSYVDVVDHGKGMSKAQLEALQQGLATNSTDGTVGERGSGLGLWLTREFIERNHGKIQISSKPDEGSVFTIVVPANRQNLRKREHEEAA